MRSTLLPLAVAIALAAAGCGGGTLNGAATTSSTATQPPATRTSVPTTLATTPRTTTAPTRTAPPTATAPPTTAPRTTPGPNAAFTAQANDVCSREVRALGAKLKQHQQLVKRRDVRDVAALLVPIEQARLAALRTLSAPPSIRARYARFTAVLQARLALLRRAVTSGAQATFIQELSQSTGRVAQLGAALGLNCSG